MILFVENTVVPYVDRVRVENDLPLRQKALCILDVYKARRGQELLDALSRNGINVGIVPGSRAAKSFN